MVEKEQFNLLSAYPDGISLPHAVTLSPRKNKRKKQLMKVNLFWKHFNLFTALTVMAQFPTKMMVIKCFSTLSVLLSAHSERLQSLQ